jgi:geranylgeranyl pyrophosphate synthase
MESDKGSQEELSALFRERGRTSLKRFEKAIFSGVENSKLLSILEDVKKIWRDTYRPTITSLSCEAVGGDPEDASEASLMIALAGAGIGIHDDIVDKSTTKRFRKTILSLYDVEGALLVGDLLIVKGLTAFQGIVEKGYPTEKVVAIIRALRRHYIEICEGVFMERSLRKNVDVDLDFFHQVLWKYGSDGEACTRLGAILGNGSEREVEALADYGRRSCYVFRLAEEVKDTLHLEGDLRRRLEFESIPLPLLYAAKVSKKNSPKLKSILEGTISSSDIETLLEICFETKAFDYVTDIAKKNVDEAKKLLRILKPSKARNFLFLMIENLFPDFFSSFS